MLLHGYPSTRINRRTDLTEVCVFFQGLPGSSARISQETEDGRFLDDDGHGRLPYGPSYGGTALLTTAQITDTVLIVSINIIANTNSNLIDPSHPASLTPDDIEQRIFGSKMVLVTEQMQLITIWLVKACLLLMYHRLTYVPSSFQPPLWAMYEIVTLRTV